MLERGRVSGAFFWQTGGGGPLLMASEEPASLFLGGDLTPFLRSVSLRRVGSPVWPRARRSYVVGKPVPAPLAAKAYVVPCERRAAARLVSDGFAAADPGDRAGVFDSASVPRRRRRAVQAHPLRASSARPPSTPDIAARGTGTGDGRCRFLLGERSASRWFAFVSCRPGRWVPACAGTTVGGALRDCRIALWWGPLRFVCEPLRFVWEPLQRRWVLGTSLPAAAGSPA
ncbi:hypothetical protein FHS47_002021 [Lutibacter sp. SG786]|nr:hypothetical protein [Luteibacter sp. SG786]